MPSAINEEEIIRYYEDCQIDYQIVWHLNAKMCMHYGYWDKTTPNLRSAISKMNFKVAEFANISPHAYVLDAGCGVGGASIFLAKNYQCKTVGITLGEKQVMKCRKNAATCGVSEVCQFEKQNYLETHFPDNTFDVVWAIESVCYAYDKLDFLKEAFRILKPGGKLIVADFFSTDIQDGTHEAALMHKWTATWAIKAYAGIEEFWHKMETAGFSMKKREDITEKVVRSIKRLYYSFFPGIIITSISQMLGFRNRVQTANTWSTFYQYKAYQKNLWKYMFFYAEKPLNPNPTTDEPRPLTMERQRI